VSENLIEGLHRLAREAREFVAEIEETRRMFPSNSAGLDMSIALQNAIARECELAIESDDVTVMMQTFWKFSDHKEAK
jgi:hypothetical protein